MDTELLRTFLEVKRTRHFGRAAENLHLTQSAVSARIRLLEQTLGVALFVRTRNNIQLTPAGQRLERHAESILNSWTRARQEMAVEDDRVDVLAIGASPSLWDVLVESWLHALGEAAPRLALDFEVLDAATMGRRLGDRSLDVGLMYEPPRTPELEVVPVATVRLVMVSSVPRSSAAQALGAGYVLVDWGTTFAVAHARHFPDMPNPAIRVDLGRLAHAFVLHRGGAAYLADSMVAGDVARGRLHVVEDAPVIERVAHAAWARESERCATIAEAIGVLEHTARPQAARSGAAD